MRRAIIAAGILFGAYGALAGVANYYKQLTTLPRATAAASPAQNNFEWLLHFDEAPGSTNFLDSGKTNLTVSTVGAGISNNANGKFGGCVNFSQVGARSLKIRNLDAKLAALGTNDWTFDFWVKLTAARYSASLYAASDIAPYRTFCRVVVGSTTTQCKISNDGSSAPLDLSGSMDWSLLTNQWVHLAFIRNTNQFWVYTNGARSTLGGSLAGQSFTWSSMTNFIVGDSGGTLNPPEFIDEVALRARAVWKHTNFVPPTAAYTTSD